MYFSKANFHLLKNVTFSNRYLRSVLRHYSKMCDTDTRFVTLNTGDKIPMVGLGTFLSRGNELANSLKKALEVGYRHFDTAYVYENEQIIGDELTSWVNEGRLNRDELFLTTKLPPIGNRAEDVGRFLQMSLDKLQTNYLDLYLIHFPFGAIGKDDNDIIPKDKDGNYVMDLSTDLENVWKAMEKQVDLGKTRAIGLSNFNENQIERIMKVARIKPANLQVEMHAYLNQKNLRTLCARYGISVTGYGPLGSPYRKKGSLLLEISRTAEYPDLLQHPSVLKISQRFGNKTPAQILLRYLVQLGVIVIPKSSNELRLRENLQIFDFELTAEDLSELNKLDQNGKWRAIDCSLFTGVTAHPEYPFHRSN